MGRILMFIVFLSIVTIIYFGMHYVVFKALVKGFDMAKGTVFWFRIFFIASGLSFYASIILSRAFHIYVLNYYAYVWLGILAIAFAVSLLQWLLMAFFPAHTRHFAIVAVVLMVGLSAYSLANGMRKPVVRQLDIPLKNLPTDREGFSVVQLSDVHLEKYKSTHAIKDIVEIVNSLYPDLVVITGDLIDGNVCEDGYFCGQLLKLNPTHGTIGITGNHEYFAGIDMFLEIARESKIKVLRNEMIVVDDWLQVIGVEDREAGRFGAAKADIESLIAACDPKKPILLLNHRPSGFDEAAAMGVDLQLSGHTHAGQIPPLDILVYFMYKYHYGLFEKNGSYIYTSSGTGFWGPPMRLSSRNEIVRFVFKKGE